MHCTILTRDIGFKVQKGRTMKTKLFLKKRSTLILNSAEENGIIFLDINCVEFNCILVFNISDIGFLIYLTINQILKTT